MINTGGDTNNPPLTSSGQEVGCPHKGTPQINEEAVLLPSPIGEVNQDRGLERETQTPVLPRGE